MENIKNQNVNPELDKKDIYVHVEKENGLASKFPLRFVKCVDCHRIVGERDFRWGDTVMLRRFRHQQCGCFEESTRRNMIIKVTTEEL